MKKEIAQSRADVKVVRQFLETTDVIESVIKSFDGKVINRRFTNKIKEKLDEIGFKSGYYTLGPSLFYTTVVSLDYNSADRSYSYGKQIVYANANIYFYLSVNNDGRLDAQKTLKVVEQLKDNLNNRLEKEVTDEVLEEITKSKRKIEEMVNQHNKKFRDYYIESSMLNVNYF